MSAFSFLLTLPAPASFILLSTYESVPIFLVSLVCSLDSTHEWNMKEFVFLWWDLYTMEYYSATKKKEHFTLCDSKDAPGEHDAKWSKVTFPQELTVLERQRPVAGEEST